VEMQATEPTGEWPFVQGVQELTAPVEKWFLGQGMESVLLPVGTCPAPATLQ